MVLPKSDFEIIARLVFQPYAAEWRRVHAETLEWADEPEPTLVFGPEAHREKTWVRVRIDDVKAPASSVGLPSVTISMNRATIPRDVLQPHENHSRTPDIAGRLFSVLICLKSEFKNPHSDLKPGDSTKIARFMRDEFLNLKADPELGWDGSLCHFLNRWGLWEYGGGFTRDWVALSLTGMRVERPGFVLAVPHLLREEQEDYRRALMKSNARRWLRAHPLSLETADEPPFFFVRRSYCKLAIEATITINHLAKTRIGICKRCHNIFEKETLHRKNYCSEPCINAAGVQRWRDKQRKMQKKGAKRDANG